MFHIYNVKKYGSKHISAYFIFYVVLTVTSEGYHTDTLNHISMFLLLKRCISFILSTTQLQSNMLGLLVTWSHTMMQDKENLNNMVSNTYWITAVLKVETVIITKVPNTSNKSRIHLDKHLWVVSSTFFHVQESSSLFLIVIGTYWLDRCKSDSNTILWS